MEIPLGAGAKVDAIKGKILEKLGQENYDKLVKKNFKNYTK